MTFRKLTRAAAFGFFALLSGGVLAQIVSSLPFTLQNNTLADATQVMANLNQIVSNVNANSAKNGVNTDITVLSALSTPLTRAQGGSAYYIGGTSTGTANAQVVGTIVPTGFALAAGLKVSFTASLGNTAAMTLNVAGTGAKNVYRSAPGGPILAAGGEITGGNMVVEVIYDGSAWQLITNALPMFPGVSISYRGPTVPVGFLSEDGSCVSRTTFAGLFTAIGTVYGVCDGVTTFGLPDSRGRLDAGKDDQGGVAANRITNAGSGCTGTTFGLGCGAENHVMTAGELVAHTHPSPAVTADSHSHTLTSGAVQNASNLAVALGAAAVYAFPANSVSATTATSGFVTLAATTGSSGASAAMPVLNPLLITNKAIRY